MLATGCSAFRNGIGSQTIPLDVLAPLLGKRSITVSVGIRKLFLVAAGVRDANLEATSPDALRSGRVGFVEPGRCPPDTGRLIGEAWRWSCGIELVVSPALISHQSCDIAGTLRQAVCRFSLTPAGCDCEKTTKWLPDFPLAAGTTPAPIGVSISGFEASGGRTTEQAIEQ